MREDPNRHFIVVRVRVGVGALDVVFAGRAGVCATAAVWGVCGANRRKFASNFPIQKPTTITTMPITSGISDGRDPEEEDERDGLTGRLGLRRTTGVRTGIGAGSSWR